jgi:hypothetical protein
MSWTVDGDMQQSQALQDSVYLLHKTLNIPHQDGAKSEQQSF